MSATAMLATHAIARQENKSPFFFSRFNFDRMTERGNTHYCFHCGGEWGFRPDKKGNATNCEDTKATLYKPNGDEIKVREALADTELEPLLTNEPGYKRRKPEDRDYDEWLGYGANFTFCSELVALAETRVYKLHRYNPMEKHDPQTHAEAVIGKADKYRNVGTWLGQIVALKDFPYIVNVPSTM